MRPKEITETCAGAMELFSQAGLDGHDKLIFRPRKIARRGADQAGNQAMELLVNDPSSAKNPMPYQLDP